MYNDELIESSKIKWQTFLKAIFPVCSATLSVRMPFYDGYRDGERLCSRCFCECL